MTKFLYKAINAQGATDSDVREAADQFALAKDLEREGKTLVSASEEAKNKTLGALNISFGGVKLADKITFAKTSAP